MNDQPRPVWLDRSQRNRLEERLRLVGRGCSTETDVLEAILAGWDAAPADATEAADDAIAAKYQADGLLYGQHIRHMADAVLRALGRPS